MSDPVGIEVAMPDGPLLPGNARVVKGSALLPLSKGPWTSSHIARWCAAQQNWDKIHYDRSYAIDVAKLPGTIINGALKQHLIVQFLVEAFDGRAWIWRIDYRFGAMDLVGQSLEVRGAIAGVRRHEGRYFVSIDVSIHNRDQDKVTTTGTAIVVCHGGDGVEWMDSAGVETPPDLRLDEAVGSEDPSTPQRVRSKLGARLEYVESDYAIDLSRLRLFADAIGGLRPVHFDPHSPQARKHGGVLAPPLFPIHGLEALPGKLPLSSDPQAMGREGVYEVGRDMARHFGIEIAWNGGNKVEVHSLARVGERICAESTLVSARSRTGRQAGSMIIFETLNRYRVVDGRPLITERQTMICRSEEIGVAGER